jgi:PAS domain S-box-containing protein
MAETSDQAKSKGQLIEELENLRRQLTEVHEHKALDHSEDRVSSDPDNGDGYQSRGAWDGMADIITVDKQAESEVDRLNRQLTELHSLGQALISTLDLEETLDTIIERVTQLMESEAASIILLDEATDQLWFAAASGEGAEFIRSVRLSLGQGIAGWVAEHGEPVIVPDVSKDTRWFKGFDKGSGVATRSILCVPLSAAGRIIGAVEVMNKKRGTFDQGDVRWLSSLAALAAAAIETARLHDKSQREMLGRRRAEEALLESKTRLEVLLESAPNGILVIDAETHRIVDANPAAVAMIGLAPEQIIGSVCHDYVCPALEGCCPITDLGQAVDNSERILLNGEGKEVPILKSVTSVMLDGREHLIESFVDITERKETELALRESEEKHREILQNIEEGYFEVDLAGNFTFFNETLCEFLGYSGKELLGMNNRRYMSEESAKRVFRIFNEVYQSGEPARFSDWEIVRKDGTTRVLESSVLLMQEGDGNPTGFRGIVRDITGHRQAEREREELLNTLERRSTHLQTAAEVSRAVSSILDPQMLALQVVDLVRERFDLYYAGLFLVDTTGEWTGEPHRWAVLRAGTGEAGRRMLEQGHKLEVGGASMIGWCIANSQARIALDVGEDAIRFNNPHLPETRSELALPLTMRGCPIGALTIQSSQEAAFSKEDITVLQTMADQLANAIANAQLYEETQRRLREQTLLFDASRRLAGAPLQATEIAEIAARQLAQVMGDVECSFSVLDPREKTLQILADVSIEDGVERWHSDIERFSLLDYPATRRVMETLEPLVVQANDPDADPAELAYMQEYDIKTLAIFPLAVKGQTIGIIELESEEDSHYTPEELNMAMTLANQAAVALENARLYETMEQDLDERRRMEEALQEAHEELERYTHSLERQAAQFRVAASVAREAVGILDVQRLLDTTVRLISDGFGFYHAGVFLTDDRGEYAVLRAASSEGGQRMLARGHKLRVGKVGIVGYVAATGEPRIALDVDEDAVHFAHGDLPDTRSEMGLPLKVRGKTIGALDVQDTREAAFSDDDVAALQTLADQLAVAVDNARLAERTEAQLRELSLLHGEYGAATVTELASAERARGYVYDRIDVMPMDKMHVSAKDMPPTRAETFAYVEPERTESTLATPLKLHGQVIGNLGIQETEGGRRWSSSEIALVEAVSEQVALALENAQHFAATQRAAQQRQLLNELAKALAANLRVEAVLEETYKGASRLLDTTNFNIALYDAESNSLSFPLAIEDGRRAEWQPRPMGQGLSEYVVRTRRPLLIEEDLVRRLGELGIELMLVGNQKPALSWLGVPLLIGERVLGLVAVQSMTTPRAYDEQDRDLLMAIASQTAIALQNAYLFGETEAALGETQTLYRVGEIISRLGDWEETTQNLADLLVNQLGYGGAWLALVDRQGLRGVVGAGADVMAGAGLEPIRLDPQSQNPLVRAVLDREPVVINDPLQNGQAAAYLGNNAGPVAGVPILIGNEVVGVLVVSRAAGAPDITGRDLEVLDAVADQASVALQNNRLLEQAQRRAAQLAAASEVARDATAILEVDQLLDETVQLISQQFGFYHAGVFLLDEAGEYAVLRAASSIGGQRMLERGHRLPVGKVGIVGYVAAAGEPRIALDVGEDAMHFVNPDLPNTRSEMGLPLKVRDQVIGVLDVQSTEEAAFSDEDVATMETLADQLAAAIANARLFDDVRTEAARRTLLNEVQQAGIASLDPEELLHRSGEVISQRMSKCSAAFIWSAEEGCLRLVAAHDEDGLDIPSVDDVALTREMSPAIFSDVVDRQSLAMLEAQTAFVSQASAALAKRLGIQTGVFLPLVGRNQVLGVLAIDQSDEETEDLDFIESIGTNLSVALESTRLYREAVETAEQLQEMDRLKSQFLANMSHELRTPLNSIIGFSRVILKGIDGPLTDTQRTDLETVYNSGQHLLELINSILDISKIQAGKMELSFEDTDLKDVIHVVMSTAIALVKDKPIELQQSVPETLPIIRVDPRRIRQVLLNVVGNAAKFTEEGFIRMEASVTPTEIIISVSDSGIGIPEDKQENIFEEFVQVDGSSTRIAGGTGLGLSISRHFVEMHGGRIWVESTAGVGSTFSIALPLAGPPEPADERVEPVEEEVDVEMGQKPDPEAEQQVVLCVDDDEGVITLFRRYLSKQGYQVVGLSDSLAAVERAEQLKPFAITLDIMMPEKDGWQVIRELKANPNTRDIPVIVCSIVANEDQGVSLGAADYLVKPILEDDLVSALDRLDRQGTGPHKVLIVDDHSGDRNLVRRMIEAQEGYEILEAAGGQEAIALVHTERPHIIILDLMMPDLDGFAVLESIKADKTTRSIPVIVVTAKILTAEEQDTLNRRVQSLLQKGIFEQEELLADVAAALERLAPVGDE